MSEEKNGKVGWISMVVFLVMILVVFGISREAWRSELPEVPKTVISEQSNQLRYLKFSGIQVIKVGEDMQLGFPLDVQVRPDYLELEENNFVKVKVSEFMDHQRYLVTDDVYKGLSDKLACTE